MSKFKTLYEFSIPKQVEVEEKEESTNENGDKVTVTKKVIKEVPQRFAISRPTRSQLKDADLYYNVTVSEGIKAGLMSAQLLAKRYINDGGPLSEDEKEFNNQRLLDRLKAEVELKELEDKSEKTPEIEDSIVAIKLRIENLDAEIREFSIRQQALFNITAEYRARNYTLVWWLLHLLYKAKDQFVWEPFFEGDTFKDKEAAQDHYEDDEVYSEKDIEFFRKVLEHANNAVALWYYNRATNQKEFEEGLQAIQEATTN